MSNRLGGIEYLWFLVNLMYLLDDSVEYPLPQEPMCFPLWNEPHRLLQSFNWRPTMLVQNLVRLRYGYEYMQ